MSDQQARPAHRLDGSQLDPSRLLEELRGLPADCLVQVDGLPSELAGVCAGLAHPLEVLIRSVGACAYLMGQSATIEISENAGWACGHSMHSGSLLVHGDAANFFGAYAIGGFLTAYGKAGDYVGCGLSGAEVLVRSRCGNSAASGMRSGILVLGNGAGDNLGQGMSGGMIYVRGAIGSLAPGVEPVRMKEADSLRLGLLLARAGLKSTIDRFQAFRALAGSNSTP